MSASIQRIQCMDNNSFGGFHFCSVVWGESFVDKFLNLSLPCQLSLGNLPAISFSKKAGHKYYVFTTSQDARVIQKSPTFVRLSETISTEIHLADDVMERMNSGKMLLRTLHHIWVILQQDYPANPEPHIQ